MQDREAQRRAVILARHEIRNKEQEERERIGDRLAKMICERVDTYDTKVCFVYFRFNIEHDETPKLVKIGGTSNYKSRATQHMGSGSCYIIVYDTQSGDSFRTVEASIKKSHFLQRHYNEEYYYTEGMIRAIAKSHDLKLVTVCVPYKLHKGFSFIYRHIARMIGKDYTIHEIGMPCDDTQLIEDSMSTLTITGNDNVISVKAEIIHVKNYADDYFDQQFHLDFPKGARATEFMTKVNDYMVKCGIQPFKSSVSFSKYVLEYGDSKVFIKTRGNKAMIYKKC